MRMLWWRIQFPFIRLWKKWKNRKVYGYKIHGPYEVFLDNGSGYKSIGKSKYLEEFPEPVEISMDLPYDPEMLKLFFAGSETKNTDDHQS